MEHDDVVDASMYAVKGMSLGFEVTPEQAEQVRKIKVDHATAATIRATGRYSFAPTGSTSSTVNLGPATSLEGRPVETRPFMVNPDMAMLENTASPYNIDPETLVNLWAVRFGKEWVGGDVVEESEAVDGQPGFWQHTANRLRELGYLEMHTLASSYRVVLRIVE